MKKEIKEKIESEELEDWWDWICIQVGFDKNGKKIQKGIKRFVELQKQKLVEEIWRLWFDWIPKNRKEDRARHFLIYLEQRIKK